MEISSKTIDIELLKKRMISPDAGAYTSFEGWVRNENEGRRVIRLEYEVYDLLAVKDMLGHEDLSSTQIYTQVSIKKLKEVYRKAHPHG